MPLKKTISKHWAGWIGIAVLVHVLVALFAGGALANCPSLSASITHEPSSYAELCGVGEIVIRVYHPDRNADLTRLRVTEDLLASGLEYVDNSTSFAVRFGAAPSTANISTSGNQITWDFGNYLLEASPNSGVDQYLEIRFQVTQPNNELEELVTNDRNLQVFVEFETINERGGLEWCEDTRNSSDVVLLREPIPVVNKQGQNRDADQDGWTQNIYGHNDDDVIWRIEVRNNGLADLQDLRFDDVMAGGSMQVNYICPTEWEAEQIADNDGTPQGGTRCQVVGNSFNDYDVDNPFGNPPGDSPDLVDVIQRESTYIYLVGKIEDNGSCTDGGRTNTVYDIEWGCQEDNYPSGAGGISQTSTGASPGSAASTIYTRYGDLDDRLTVNRQLTGVNVNQPVGSRGTMTITIINNTGGTVKDIRLTDTLPVNYVMDPTYTPTLVVTGAYGYYPGLTNRIEWTNRVDPTSVAAALSNDEPVFRLYSSEAHPDYLFEQVNMLRHGDRLVIRFRVVLINPTYYDLQADLDVMPENSPGTDPPDPATLINTLRVEYDTFCSGDGHEDFTLTGNGTGYPNGSPIRVEPEDLDVAIENDVYVLTGDPDQQLTLPVIITNNGGHDASNYHAFVSFGTTMQVESWPAGCTEISPLSGTPPQPDPWLVWIKDSTDPIAIPSTASVFECTSPATIGPGQDVRLEFNVVKTTDLIRIGYDDLTFRADVVGEIFLSDNTPLWFPAPGVRGDDLTDRGNNYSLDSVWARVIGFNLKKNQVGTCSENNTLAGMPIVDTINFRPVERVEIGEECTFHIETGGWFGFETPGFAYIAVRNIDVVDQLPDGQAYISRTTPYYDPAIPTETSTQLIKNVTFNPAGLLPVTEGDFDWRFNENDADRIEVADEWFRVNVTTRILNDATNARSGPNAHTQGSHNVLDSTFEAIFANLNTGEIEPITITNNTVGFPEEPIRRVDVTITEPHLEVVKEVCNESLHGNGTSCDTWTPFTSEGDTYDSYIYRITVRNLASVGGMASAPAYDVVVTDTLDPSDLMYVEPFNADNLDNDGDGSFDESGVNEGDISNNVVLDGNAAVITFSHAHSNALRRIEPGAQLRLYYRVDPDEHALPEQQLTNQVVVEYDTLAGSTNESSNQTVDLRPNGDIGGARVYSDATAEATVQILAVLSYPKEVLRRSNPMPSGTQGVSIGEEIEYQLAADLPVARLRNFHIYDQLPDGLSCSEAPTVDLNAAPYNAAGFLRPDGSTIPPITPICEADQVTWQFGDVVLRKKPAGENYFHFPVAFIARVENNTITNQDVALVNGQPTTNAALEYTDDSGNTIVKEFSEVELIVNEPAIVLTKSFSVANADAGDILTVTVTAANSGTATAYNLRVLDDLRGRDLTFMGNVGGNDPPDTIDTTTLGANRPIFSWNPPNGIEPGAGVSFTFEVRVDTLAQPQEVLDNTIQAHWTSLPGQTTALNSSGRIGADGSETGMRIGALPNAGDAVNDYESVADSAVSVPPVTMTKTDLDPTAIPAIGLHKYFQLDIRLPEGTTRDVLVTDSLDASQVSYLLANNAGFDIAYTFTGIATINGQTPGEAAFNAFPTDGAGGSVVWDIGTVVTETENDPSQTAIDPLIRIRYYARINNDLVTDSGDTLQNGAVMNYSHGETGGQEILTDTAALVTVVEPVLAATKTVSNVTSGKQPADLPSGGDLLEYVVAVLNSGTSTAHDVNLVDTLPLNLSLYTGFTPTALINGAVVAGFITTPANTPNGPLVWGRDNGDDSLDIPVGQSLVLTYRAVVQAAGGDISNSILIDWTSLDGASGFERTGDGCPNWTAPNDYCSGPAVAVTTTVDTNSIDKTVSADTFDTEPWSTAADAVARVGDFITYRLALNLSGGLTRNVRVQDTLPSGMAFVDTVRINGDTAASYTPPSTGTGSNFVYAAISSANVPAAAQTGVLTWAIGDVVNDPFGDPTTDTLEIVYRARILPDAGIAHVATTTLTNSVDMDYATAAGPALTQTDSATITVVQPILTAAKSAVAAGGDTVLAADEMVTYTVDILNSGNAPAYDAQLRDIIPLGMRNGSATIPMVTPVSTQLLSGSVLPNLTPAYDPSTGVAVWNFDSGAADQYAIPAGDTLRIVYELQTDGDMGAGLTLTNQAQVQLYDSLDDEDIPSQGGVNGEPQVYGPSNIASVTFTTATPDALIKDNPAVLTVAVGQPFAYRITVPATPHDTALHDVRILDDLGASAADLVFVSVAKVSGSRPWTPVNTGTPTNLVIEDTVSGIDIPAGEQIVIDITVMLENTDANVSGLAFNNTAAYTYNAVNDTPATQAAGGSDTTADMTIVAAEVVTLEKTGPSTMQVGIPAAFTLNVHNPNAGPAWYPVITDQMANAAAGGMCAAGPVNVSAELFFNDGTSVSGPLVAGTDFEVIFDGEPDCQWQFRLLPPAGSIGPDQRLIINYEAQLDYDTENAALLTNLAGVTQWLSADPDIPGAAPQTYTRDITDGTPGVLDHEDSHSVTCQAPILEFLKTVVNVTSGADPGSNAIPGDILRYTIRLTNSGPVGLTGFAVLDEVDRLNAAPFFAPGTLNLVSVPAGADISGTSASGGTLGSGVVNVAALEIGPQGAATDTLSVVFEITLAPVITHGSMVRNQAELILGGSGGFYSDDPNPSGDNDPTETLIASAPVFQVQKTSTVMTGDPLVLMAGDTLRYTITVSNIGNEDAVNVTLRDNIPANTAYVAGSTTLNGTPVPDPGSGQTALTAGVPINPPASATAGVMPAYNPPGAGNTATVTFDVVVDPSAMDGVLIANQGFVSGNGQGSGQQPEQPSDDPTTVIPDDPTMDVVGNQPLLYAQKTVEIIEDYGSAGIVDPDDVLRYTITISNAGGIPATGAEFIDPIPEYTTHVAGTLRVNGVFPGPGGGAWPPDSGLPIQSSDSPGAGVISAGYNAVTTFDVVVNSGVAPGTLIINQGSVTSNELPPEPTDADGVPSNGDQPTIVVVGDVQMLTITKEVVVVGGGPATAGGQLEYAIRVTNIGSLPATNVVIRDDFSLPLGNQVAYVAGSATLNGATGGVSYSAPVLSADYASQYGDLSPGAAAVVRFRVQINSDLAIGTTITNTADVRWNNPQQAESASVSIDVGGTPGSAGLNGNVWHDANLDKFHDGSELPLEGWSVELYSNNRLVTTVLTDADGVYHFTGLVPSEGTLPSYELRFSEPGAGPNTATLGHADSLFTNGPHRISAISAASGAYLQDLNLPISPNGAVYNSVVRVPVAGARLALINAASGEALPGRCFDDPLQQNQLTGPSGFYKFDLNFSDAACPTGGAYLIEVTSPASGYLAAPSRIIPPASDATTAAFSIPACPGSAADALPATAAYCEVTPVATVPPLSALPRTDGTIYHLHLLLSDGDVPGQSQIFNNPIPIDPQLDGAVAITKTTAQINVTRGSLVPYSITVTNVLGVPLYDISIVDNFPAGFKYVGGSARLDGDPAEPLINGRQLIWDDLELQVNQKYTLELLLVVGSGVSEGEYVNRAQVRNEATGTAVSGEATATVQVVPDPDFDCSDVIGKVFDDRNLNGQQDPDEKGLAGVRVVTVRGLIATTDQHGRFHITCAMTPDWDRGSNFILKLDEHSLPTGYRLTTENPRVLRATRGKMIRFKFGATIHRVVRIDFADGVFEPDTSTLRLQWVPRIEQLLQELNKAPSVLRLSYLADVEGKGLVEDRLDALKKMITSQWEQSDGGYRLVVETEIFWRRGAPIAGR